MNIEHSGDHMMPARIDNLRSIRRLKFRPDCSDLLSHDADVGDARTKRRHDISTRYDLIESHRGTQNSRGLVGLKSAVNDVEREISILGGDAHRRLDADDIAVETALSDQ
jgi:hypothetical protein